MNTRHFYTTMHPDGSPALSIAVCTHNRSHLAMECLTGILSQANCHSVEVLVVDNSSRLDDAIALETWCRSHSSITYLRETRVGLSRARNRAVEHARASWLAFLDDDAVVRERWLESVLSFVSSAEPDIAGFGGPVFPRWPAQMAHGTVPPNRLGRLWCEFLSLTDPSALAGATTPRVLGCNMILRTSTVRDLGGFVEAFGRTPTSLQGGEEIDLLRRMAQSGHRVCFETSARVDHVIHGDRLTRRWIKQRVIDEGRVSSVFRTDVPFLALQVLALPPLAACALLTGLSNAEQVHSHDNYVRFWRNWGYVLGVTSNVYKRSLSAYSTAESAVAPISTGGG